VKNKMEKIQSHYVSNVHSLFVLEIVSVFIQYKNVYMQKAIISELTKKIPNARISNNLFTSTTLSLLTSENMGRLTDIPRWVWRSIVAWTQEFFTCDCQEKPFCPCGRKNFEKIVIALRFMNYSPDEIMEYLKKNYSIRIFRGDLIDYFEQLIFGLETINKIARSIKLDEYVKKEIDPIEIIINLLQR
jgi:helicase